MLGMQRKQEGDGIFMRDPTSLPPSARKLLEQIGNQPITSIEIVRTPLSSFTRGFLNVISLGQFDKISKKSYDQIFHLSLWINGKYNLEKNEVIAFNTKNPKEAKSEVKTVSNIPSGLTFQTLIDKTKARMGANFGPYDAQTNNCQDFLMNIFQANGIGDQSDLSFIKQDTKEIFSRLPEFSKVLGKAATNLGAIFDRLLYGEGQIGGAGEDIDQINKDLDVVRKKYGEAIKEIPTLEKDIETGIKILQKKSDFIDRDEIEKNLNFYRSELKKFKSQRDDSLNEIKRLERLLREAKKIAELDTYGEGQIGGMDDIVEVDDEIEEDQTIGRLEDEIKGIYDKERIPYFLLELNRIQQGLDNALANPSITDQAASFFRKRIQKVQKLRRKVLRAQTGDGRCGCMAHRNYASSLMR